MTDTLRVEPRDVEGWTVLAATGEVDVATASILRGALQAASEFGAGVIVDLTGVTFLDSTGLGVLIGGRKAIDASDGELRVVVADTIVRRVFEITGLDEVFSIHASVAEAIAGGAREPS